MFLRQQMRPALPDGTPQELVFIVQSCWVEDPNMRPSFTQIIRMLNSFQQTITPPQDLKPAESSAVVTNRSGSTVISTIVSRVNGKLSFLRQLLTAKKLGHT
jgi:Protein tyrosine and serine/threonine kinase